MAGTGLVFRLLPTQAILGFHFKACRSMTNELGVIGVKNHKDLSPNTKSCTEKDFLIKVLYHREFLKDAMDIPGCL